ncbi:MAG: leucine-rich repeat protein, partial [Ruminococcus sp.]|nr:leucine-rich repeat protein [Ruminococcus sp.]
TSIGIGAFKGCTGLTEITIPDSVTSIEDWTFSECSELTEITILNPECEIDDSKGTISTGYNFSNLDYYFNGTIKGYENSTAQAYAEENGYTFQSLGEAPTLPLGNINDDEYIDAVDATAVLMEYAELSTGGGTTLNYAQRKAGDVNGDGEINAVDATLILNYYSEVSTGNKITFPDFISANT